MFPQDFLQDFLAPLALTGLNGRSLPGPGPPELSSAPGAAAKFSPASRNRGTVLTAFGRRCHKIIAGWII